MSRSYRKNPILKDGGRKKHHDKQLASRRFRHTAKNKMRAGEFDILPVKSYETTCPWDICDWRSRWTKKEAIDTFYKLGPARWWGHTEEEAGIKWAKEFYWK